MLLRTTSSGGKGTYDFDYLVMAVRKGYEGYQVIRPTLEEPTAPNEMRFYSDALPASIDADAGQEGRDAWNLERKYGGNDEHP